MTRRNSRPSFASTGEDWHELLGHARNEAETRAEHIDPALKAAGRGVVEASRILREYPITLDRIEGHG